MIREDDLPGEIIHGKGKPTQWTPSGLTEGRLGRPPFLASPDTPPEGVSGPAGSSTSAVTIWPISPVSGIRGDRMNSVSRRGEGGGCRRTLVHFAGDDYDHEALLDDQQRAGEAAA